MSAGFMAMPRSSKQIPFRTWGSFSPRETQWQPRKRHYLNKLWKQLLTSKKISNFDYIESTELKDLFYKMAVPILNYSAEVWGFHLGVDVERVHLKFFEKSIGGQAQYAEWFYLRCGEYGTTPLREIRKIQILKYWARIVSNEKSGMVTNCYNVMYNHSFITENFTNWASRVTDLLFSLGFGECWFQQSVGDIQSFISIADQRIKDQYLQQWHGNLESSTRARTYRALRSNFTSQTYLQCIHSSEHLKSLTRFVTSKSPSQSGDRPMG